MNRPENLSIRQTIAICYNLPRERYVASANSDAVEHLRSIIAKSKHNKASAYALNVLGAIGNEDDLGMCLKILQAELQKPSPHLHLVDNAFDSLGRFAKRDIGQSRRLLLQMASPEYWHDSKFDAFREESKGSRRFDEYTVPQAIYAIAAAGLPGAESLAQKAIDKYPDGELREWAEARLRPETIKGHEAALSKAAKEEITFEDRQALDRVYARIETSELELVQLPSVESVSSAPTVTPADTGARPKLRQLSNQEKDILAKEAREAYAELTAQLKKSEFESQISHLLSKAMFIDKDRQTERRDEILAGLKEIQPLVLEVDSLKPKPGKAEVAVELGEGKESSTEITVVTWKLDGTEEIGKRIAKFAGDRHTVDLRTGTLIVLMKRKGGVWHWNPFGW